MTNGTTHTQYTASNPGYSVFKRISWGAVLAGVVIALVTHLVLSLLGLGIGLSTIDPLEEANPLNGLGIGSVIWWGVSMLISLFIGGWVAGRLAVSPTAADSMLHGVLTWSLTTLITFFLLSTMVGKIIGGVGNVLGTVLNSTGKAVSAVAPEVGQAIKGEMQENGVDFSNIKQEAVQLLKDTGKPELQPEALKQTGQSAAQIAKQGAGDVASNPNNTGGEIDQIVNNLFKTGAEVTDEVDREAAVNVVVKRTGKSREEASRIVDGWIRKGQEAKAAFEQQAQKAKQATIHAAEATAKAASKAAIYASIGLILGCIAAAIGGRMGRPTELAYSENEWDEFEKDKPVANHKKEIY